MNSGGQQPIPDTIGVPPMQPGLGSAIMDFFAVPFDVVPHNGDKRSLGEFVRHLADTRHACAHEPVPRVLAALRRLEDRGWVWRSGSKRDGGLPLNYCYAADISEAKTLVRDPFAYGLFDCVVEGLPGVHARMHPLVRFLHRYSVDGQQTNGTCFVLAGGRHIVTNGHCIEGAARVHVEGVAATPTRVLLSQHPGPDLAVLEYAEPIAERGIALRESAPTLTEVLSVGYPPLQGFDAIQLADAGHIALSDWRAARPLQSAAGRIAGAGTAYLDGLRYVLVTTRIRGGNSGGPVLDGAGLAVGVAVGFPTDDAGTPNDFGYSLAVPADELTKLLAQGHARSIDVQPANSGDGWFTVAG